MNLGHTGGRRVQPLTTTLPLLPKMYEYEGNQKKKKIIKQFEQQQCAHLCLICQIVIFQTLIIHLN